MKNRRICKELLACVHIGMILPLFVPTICLLQTERQDKALPLMYLAGTVLVICAVASYSAAKHARSFWTYLAVCLVSSGMTIFLGTWLTRGRLTDDLQNMFILGLTGGCIWICALSAGVRMREKRRQQAKKENDISWRDTTGMMEKPGWFGLGLFAFSYLVSLLNNCPVFCNTVLIGSVIYSLLFLIWREMDVADGFLDETKRIENVPRRKILVMRGRKLLLLGMILAAAAISATLTVGNRTYRDLRTMSFSTVIDGDRLHFETEPVSLDELLPDWVSEPQRGEETPEIFRRLNGILIWIALAGIVLFLIGIVRKYAVSFRGLPEENGDVAISLAPDTAVRLKGRKLRRQRGPLSEEEKVRRQYRRTIRSYRKRSQLPGPCETPSQIEEGTAFPEDFDMKALHDAYEKARYGVQSEELRVESGVKS